MEVCYPLDALISFQWLFLASSQPSTPSQPDETPAVLLHVLVYRIFLEYVKNTL